MGTSDQGAPAPPVAAPPSRLSPGLRRSIFIPTLPGLQVTLLCLTAQRAPRPGLCGLRERRRPLVAAGLRTGDLSALAPSQGTSPGSP